MLDITAIDKDQHGSTKCVIEYMKATEYYKLGLGADWLGKGAEKLKLNGLDPQQTNLAFDRLLDGFDPQTGQKLFQNSGKLNRTMCWDLTYKAPKSVSLVYADADPELQRAIMECHHQAEEEATQWLTSQLVSRRGKGGVERVKADGFVIRRVDHFDSRDKDPLLHSHLCLINRAENADGKIRTIEESELFECRFSASALYEHKLALKLKALGFHINRQRVKDIDGRAGWNVRWEIAGVSRGTIWHFSKRRKAIVETVKEAKARGEELTRNQASLLTRQGKTDENDPARVIASTKEELAQMRRQGLVDWQTVEDLKQAQPVEEFKPRTLAEMFGFLHEHQSHWQEKDLVGAIARERPDLANPAEATKQLLARMEQEGQVLRVASDSKGRVRYCSRQQYDLERAITQSAGARMEETSHRLDPGQVNRTIEQYQQAQGFTLSPEQAEAVRFVASESGGTAVVKGHAGTGKTTTAQVYAKAFKDAGLTVLGTAIAQSASEKLEKETEIKSYNCADLLRRLEDGRLALDSKTVLVFDEAGMTGAKTLRNIQERMDKAGAKLVLVGDEKQLQPIEAGNPFAQISKTIPSRKISEIRRQKQAQDRELATDFYQGKTGQDIVETWEQHGQLSMAENKQQAINDLAQAYLFDPNPDKLILASSHAQAEAITYKVREGLKKQGALTKARTFTVSPRKGDLGDKETKEFCVGEQIVFLKNKGGKERFTNGDKGTVQDWKQNQRGEHILRVLREKDHKTVEVNLSHYDRLDYAYVSTIHKAQGQGKENVYWLATAGRGLDRNMGLVAFTRTKGTFKAFTTPADRAKLADRLDSWGEKEGVVELRKQYEQQQRQAETRQLGQDLASIKSQRAEHLAQAKRQAEQQRVADQAKREAEKQAEARAKQEQTQRGLAQYEETAKIWAKNLTRLEAIPVELAHLVRALEANEGAWRARKDDYAKSKKEHAERVKTLDELKNLGFWRKMKMGTEAYNAQVKDLEATIASEKAWGDREAKEINQLKRGLEGFNRAEEDLRQERKDRRKLDEELLKRLNGQPQEVLDAYEAKKEAKQRAEAERKENARLEAKALELRSQGALYPVDINGKTRWFALTQAEGVAYLKMDKLPEGQKKELALEQFSAGIAKQFTDGLRFETRPPAKPVEPPPPTPKPKLARGLSMGM